MVAVIMGSISDMPIMKKTLETLQQFGVAYDCKIVSAHRTPQQMFEFATHAKEKGFRVIIAGAGGAAHLPGMVASLTTLPVIGVPILSSNSLDGWDSILSILQMPNGVPVATVALNAAQNAGILAVQILAVDDVTLSKKLSEYKTELFEKVNQQNETLKNGD